MGIARAFFVLFVIGNSLGACASEDAQSSAAQSPSPANSAATVVQNITYTTNVYGPATIVTSKPADGGSPVSPSDEANVVVVSPTGVTPSPDDGPSGIPECDAYLVRVSTCTHRMMARVQGAGATEATRRIDDGLASARRAWRSAMSVHPEMRGAFGRQCVDAQNQFDASMKDRCDATP